MFRNYSRFPNFPSTSMNGRPYHKTFIRHLDQEKRFVRTLHQGPLKKAASEVEIFDKFIIEKDEGQKRGTQNSTLENPKKIIEQGLNGFEGDDDIFSYSKNHKDFMFKFSFETKNLFNKTLAPNDDEIDIKTPLTTLAPLTTTTTVTTNTEEGTIATTTMNTATTPLETSSLIPETNVTQDFFHVKSDTSSSDDAIIFENEIEESTDVIMSMIEEENGPIPIQSDASKSNNPPALAQQLEDYLLVLPLQFRFLRKDSPLLLQN